MDDASHGQCVTCLFTTQGQQEALCKVMQQFGNYTMRNYTMDNMLITTR